MGERKTMRIVHISDTHNKHNDIQVPECDVVIFSGDIGGRTHPKELVNFLIWFEKLPAKVKIIIAGNHDICLDRKWVDKQKQVGSIEGLLATQHYYDCKVLIESYKVKYLCETDYVYEGVKFFGSPYSPSFHKDYWVFNADRGEEIKKKWDKIPKDTDVLITHSPAFGVLDEVSLANRTDWHVDGHVGCEDLMNAIKSRLTSLKLHCSGHIHSNYGIVLKKVSNTRNVIFSNGAVVDNSYSVLVNKPLIIEI